MESEILAFLQKLHWDTILNKKNKVVTALRSESDQSKVDLEIHRLLDPFLSSLKPMPIISEEGDLFVPTKGSGKPSYWLVDPLDGTSEFRKDIPEYAVSIAFIERGDPVLGVIYNPATREYFTTQETRFKPRREVEEAALRGDAYLLSRTEYTKRMHQKEEALKVTHLPIGSCAYKLGLLTAYRLRVGLVSYQPKSLWDVAAGAAILLKKYGVSLATLSGEKILFEDPSRRVDSLLVKPRRETRQPTLV